MHQKHTKGVRLFAGRYVKKDEQLFRRCFSALSAPFSGLPALWAAGCRVLPGGSPEPGASLRVAGGSGVMQKARGTGCPVAGAGAAGCGAVPACGAFRQLLQRRRASSRMRLRAGLPVPVRGMSPVRQMCFGCS